MNSVVHSAAIVMGLFALTACTGGAGGSATPQAMSALSQDSGLSIILGAHALPQVAGAATTMPTAPLIPSPGLPPVSLSNPPVKVNVNFALSQSVANQNHALRRPEYISSSNTVMTVVVTPVGGSGTSYGPTACTTASCTASFTANPGPNLLAFTLTDGTKTLSTYSTLQIINPSIENTLSFTANPVVNSVTLTLTSTTVNAGAATSDVLTVNALDADGKTIVGSANYTDANGNPLRLNLSISNSQNGGSGSIALNGPTILNSPSAQPITAVYNGAWMNSATISVTASRSIAGSLGTATLTTTPTINEYTGYLGNLSGLTAGPDGALWFTVASANKIGRITTAGSVTGYYTVGTYPNMVAVGADGNLWAPNENNTSMSRITPSGTVTNYTSGLTAGATPTWMAMGADGSIWFVEQTDRVGRITSSGGITEYTTGITAGADPIGITEGPDSNMWFTEYNGNRIGKITTSGTITEYSAGMTAGAKPESIITGPDGNLWFTERIGNRIGRITTAGVITEFSTNLTAGADPVSIINGPDGNLWFGEDQGGKIGTITTSGTITEYGNGITTGSSPQFITLGPDGNIWIDEYNGGRVARLVY